MSNIFYGHAPLVNGLFLLNLERDETHIHNIEAKRCKVDSDNTKCAEPSDTEKASTLYNDNQVFFHTPSLKETIKEKEEICSIQ